MRWQSVSFEHGVSSRGSGQLGLPQSEWEEGGKYPVIGQGAEFIEGWTNRVDLVLAPSPAVVLYGGHTRRAKFVDRPFVPGPNVKILEPKESLDAKFLFYFLAQLPIESRGYADHFPEVRRCSIPVPPLPEQKRIAEVLDRADALRVKRTAALAQLDCLSQSLFLDDFGDPATNPNGWPRKSIREIGKVITGNTPPRANPGYYGTHIEWIKSDNINTPHYYLTKAAEGLSESGKAVARTVPAGSILVTCIAGSPECIGNAAMTDREVAFNQQINALVPINGDAHFLYAQMLVGKRLIQEASTAGMKGMVSKGRFEQVMLIFPPLELQREFARRATAVEALKTAQSASLAKLDALFATLQHRAFRGEL